MKKITVSAPGKLMLFGEHAVVAGYPCIVTAVNQRMKVTVEVLETSHLVLFAPEVNVKNYTKKISELGLGEIEKGAKFAEYAVKNFYEKFNITCGIKITTSSEFSSSFGFGSSSAVSVCTIKALSELFKRNLSKREIFDLSYKTVLDVQGKGSGFDIASAIYGGTIYFVTGGKVIEPLQIKTIPLIVGYSGVKADTVTLMNQVSEKFKDQKLLEKSIYVGIEKIVKDGKQTIKNSDFERLGKLMNENQILLVELGVSTAKLNAMITAAISAGAYGAKISGAGGGDCMIAICPPNKTIVVEEAIKKTGGVVLHIQTNAEGVKVEK